jgi:hypothetical protein
MFEHQYADELSDFVAADIRGRISFIRRLLLGLEMEWGTVDQWPIKFSRDWESVKGGGREVVYGWFERVRMFIARGRRVIVFVESIMEGDGPSTISEYRDLWLEAQQLAIPLFNGVLGLDHRLDFAVSVYSSLSSP